MTVITVHSVVAAASAPVCPVVHTALNWVVIALLLCLIFVIASAVAWSIIDRKLAFRTPNGNGQRVAHPGESAGGHGSVQVPQLLDDRGGVT
jgi:signal transduction histidine kinase